jgi:predicted transcriptional regulator
MPEISKAESIQVNDDLNRAMHKMIVNQLESLIVFDDEKNIVGLIRSIDLFNLLRSLVEECKLEQS